MPSVFLPAPVFRDNVGQLLSHEDLDILRDNAAYCDILSLRLMPGFVSSGGPDSRTPGFYPTSGTFPLWYGNIRFRTGLTTLTIEGNAANWGSVTIRLYVNNTLRITCTPAASFSGTWAITGLADGEVADIRVDAFGTSPSNAKYVITAIYATPLTYSVSWPGVPTFVSTWSAALLTQLCDAMQWVYDRANVAPIRPDLALLYQLAPFSGENRPMYYGSVGRWFSNSQFRFGGNFMNATNTATNFDVYFNGGLVYSSGNLPIGTTVFSTAISLASYSVGQQIEVAIFVNNTVAGPKPWAFSRLTLNAARSEVDTSAIYASMLATPPADVAVARTTLAAFLNNLSATVLAAHDRIVNTPAVFSRVWAQRRFFSKTNSMSELSQRRGRPRIIRQGDRLTVRGKGVSMGWGPIVLPTNEAGLDFDNWTNVHTAPLTDTDKVSTTTVYLDNFEGLSYGLPAYIVGDVTWVEGSIQ
jgi:hypothetical protein